MTRVNLISPHDGLEISMDISGLSQLELNTFVAGLDERTIKLVNERVTKASPEAWLTEYVKLVGPEEAGRTIIK